MGTILGRDAYTIRVNEGRKEPLTARTFGEVPVNGACPTYSDMARTFRERGFRMLGTIYCEHKVFNAWDNDGFERPFKGRISEVWKESRYDYLSVHVCPEERRGVTEKEFTDVLADNVTDEVTACRTGSGKTYHVMFNRDRKYFYFMYVEKRAIDSEKLSLWLSIRTRGEDAVYSELLAVKRQKEAEERAERERVERERKADAERRAEADRIEREYKEAEEKVEKDAREHPERYRRTAWRDMPEEFRDASRHIRTSEYAEYYDCLNVSPYDVATYDVYISRRDLTGDAYVYRDEKDLSKPSTYWGD
jgi:hypothetical protein